MSGFHRVVRVAVLATACALLLAQSPFLWAQMQREPWSVVAIASPIAAIGAMVLGSWFARRKLAGPAASRRTAVPAVVVGATTAVALTAMVFGALATELAWFMAQDAIRWVAWAACLGLLAPLAATADRRWWAWAFTGCALLTVVTVGLSLEAHDAGFWVRIAGIGP